MADASFIRDVSTAAPESRPAVAAGTEVKTINLALQGGGAHGAFTWGVLDRLGRESTIDVRERYL